MPKQCAYPPSCPSQVLFLQLRKLVGEAVGGGVAIAVRSAKAQRRYGEQNYSPTDGAISDRCSTLSIPGQPSALPVVLMNKAKCVNKPATPQTR